MKILTLFLLVSVWAPTVWCEEVNFAHVIEVQKEHVLIETEKMDIQTDKKYVLMGGKKGDEMVAIILVTEKKDNKATAKILSGKPQGKEILADYSPDLFKPKTPPSSWGLQYQLISSTMTAKETDLLASKTDNVEMTGASSGIYGYYNRPMNTWWILHGGVGYEPLSVSGTSSVVGCDQFQSSHCTAEIQYLSARVASRFLYDKSKYRVWGELGASLKHVLSASSTALQEDKLTQIHTWDLGVGADYVMNPKNFIPVSLQYSLYPAGSNVESSSFVLKIGYGWML